MRSVLTAVVVLTVLLAGCNFGGTGTTPTANGTAAGPTANGTTAGPTADTTVNDLAGVSGGTVTNSTALFADFETAAYTGHTDMDFSVETRNAGFQLRYQNDTDEELYQVSTTVQPGTISYYLTDGTDAAHNSSSGATQYNDTRIAPEARSTLSVPRSYIGLSQVLAWETAGTTTVDGERRFVLEADGINETDARNQGWELSAENTTVDGRLTVSPDGVIRSGDIVVETASERFDITFSLDTDEDIDVSQPGWYDESEAASA